MAGKKRATSPIARDLDSIESAIKRLRKMGFTKPGAVVAAFNLHGVPLQPGLLKKGEQIPFTVDSTFSGHAPNGHGGGH